MEHRRRRGWGVAAFLCLGWLLALAIPGAAQTNTGTFTEFNVTGAGTNPLEGTSGIAINSLGEVAGIYLASPNVAHGFVRASDGVITTFSAPGAGTAKNQGTFPTSINTNGDVAGMFADSHNVYHGFLRTAGGTFTVFNAPGAGTVAHRGTTPLSINATDVITGIYTDTSGLRHGFVRSAAGTITTFNVSGAGTTGSSQGQGTQPFNINDLGEITGFYVTSTGGFHGFLRSATGTITAPVDVPGTGASGGSEHHLAVVGTVPLAIDEGGDITGVFTDSAGLRHGFVRAASGTLTYPIDAPGVATVAGMLQGTFPAGINSLGVISGLFTDVHGVFHGFVRAVDGAITTFDAPGASSTIKDMFTGTVGIGINDSSEVTGGYIDANGVLHGFVFTPDPPAATPTFSPAAGSYATSQHVTISTSTPSATIYYTTNGTTPTTASTKYTGPVTVNATQTIKAIATAAGHSTSSVGSATYTLHIVVTLTPSTASVALSGTKVFTATVAGTANTALNWYVNGVLNGNSAQGTLTGTGLTRTYTAPPVNVPNPNPAVVKVASAADPTVLKTANVTVTDNIAVTLTPTSSTRVLGATQLFTAGISGTTNTALNWYVNDVLNGNAAQGTLTGTGLTRTYTAPPVNVPNPNPAVVKVASAADPGKNKTANVTVTDSIAVTLTPTSGSIALGATKVFTATITGFTSNSGLTWSVNGVTNGNSTQGTISGCTGTTTRVCTYTAPPVNVPNPNPAVIKVASAADPGKNKTASVTVTDSIAVTLTPTSATVVLGGAQVFTATLSGTTNTGLTWSVNGVTNGNASQGTLSACTSSAPRTCKYTAPTGSPPSPNPAVVKVASAADPGKNKTASVTVTP